MYGCRAKCDLDQREVRDKLDYTDKQLTLLTGEMKDKIKQMVEEVDRKVTHHPKFSQTWTPLNAMVLSLNLMSK